MAPSVAVGSRVLGGAIIGTLVSVGITVSIAGIVGDSETEVFVTSGVGVDGLKIATGILHTQQSANNAAPPIANFPLSFCFENHEGNC